MKLDAARAEVMRLILGLVANVAKQAGQQSEMQLLVGARQLIEAQTLPGHRRDRFRGQVAQLA